MYIGDSPTQLLDIHIGRIGNGEVECKLNQFYVIQYILLPN